MTTIQAIILGIIQGLTEFLPVSSSGHLALFQQLFGLADLEKFLFFDLVCHLGTLAAILAVYYREAAGAFFGERKVLFQVVIAIIPLFFLLPVMGFVEALFGRPEFLGYFFLITALLLAVGERYGSSCSEKILAGKRWRDALTIGCFQALALLPGVSRSGSTISAARLLGWQRRDAVTFSFLLAIPTILGGVTLHVLKIFKNGEVLWHLPLGHYLYGFLFSACVGYASLRLLITLAVRYSLKPFVWYCAAVGIFCLLYLSR